MVQLIKTLWQICLFQKGPQDVPYSKGLLIIFVGINYTLTTIFVARTQGIAHALWSSVVLLFVCLGLVYLVLRWRNLQSRFTQILTALFATNILLSLITLAFLFLTLGLAGGGSMPFLQRLGQMISFVMVIWTLTVAGHIFRQGLNTTLLWGVLLAVGLEIVNAVIFRLMVGGV